MKKYFLNSLVFLVVAVCSCGCSKLKAMKEDVPWPFGQDLCKNREIGKLYIEKSDIEPLNVKPDEAFNHTIKCTYCGAQSATNVQVELIRKVVYEGKVVKEKLELQKVSPGNNRYSAQIKVSDQAKPGIYFLDTSIRFDDNTTIYQRDRFNVTEK